MMTRDQIIDYLRQLGEELAHENLKGEILLTGGAAMCLVHEARDMTKDIDALYEPKTVINRIAVKIAERNGLPSNWLNDSVKSFVGDNASTEDFIALRGLRIQTVTAEYLLAMKLMSARQGERDYEDIRFLLNKLNVTSTPQVYKILEAYFAASEILPKTMYVIASMMKEEQEGKQ